MRQLKIKKVHNIHLKAGTEEEEVSRSGTGSIKYYNVSVSEKHKSNRSPFFLERQYIKKITAWYTDPPSTFSCRSK
jgi:hypothetical protein